MQENEIPHGLKRRKGSPFWHVSRQWNGKAVRVSTGCTDLQAATTFLRNIEQRAARAAYSDWWTAQISRAAAGDERSWVLDALKRARIRHRDDRPTTITAGQIITLAEMNGGVCEVSGIQFSDVVFGRRRPFIPSLDRRDPNTGYTFENCRFVCAITNYALSDYGDEALLILARAIVAKNLSSDCTLALTRQKQKDPPFGGS